MNRAEKNKKTVRKYELRLLMVHNCASNIAKSRAPAIVLCIAGRHWSETVAVVLLCWTPAEDTLGAWLSSSRYQTWRSGPSKPALAELLASNDMLGEKLN